MNDVTGMEVIDVLRAYLAIEWYGCRGLQDTTRPPVMVWRYDTNKMSTEQIKSAEIKIQSAVSSFRGQVEWIVDFGKRNWALAPLRVKELEDSGKYRMDLEIYAILAEQEPEVGEAAHRDLPKLAEHIKKFLLDK